MYDKDIADIINLMSPEEKNSFIKKTVRLVRQHPNDKSYGKTHREVVRNILEEL